MLLSPTAKELQQNSQHLSRLELGRKKRVLFAKALDLLRAGNSLPVTDLRDRHSAATLYPELVYLKQVSRWVTDIVYSEYADGHTSSAYSWLREGMIFCEKLPGEVSVEGFVKSNSTRSLLLAAYYNRFRLSVTELGDLDGILASMVVDPSEYSRLTLNTIDEISDSFEEFRRDPKVIGLRDEEQVKEISKFFAGGPEVSNVLLDEYRKTLESRSAVFQLPESRWLNESSETANSVGSSEEFWTKHPSVLGGLFLLIGVMDALHLPSSDFNATVLDIVLTRTQIRLTRLYLAIEKFRWLNNKLPTLVSGFE